MWTRWRNLRRAFHSVALFSPALCGRRAGATRSLPASDAGGPLSGPNSIAFQPLFAISTIRKRWKSLRSEEHTSELQSLMRISYAVFCLKKKIKHPMNTYNTYYLYYIYYVIDATDKHNQQHNVTIHK